MGNTILRMISISTLSCVIASASALPAERTVPVQEPSLFSLAGGMKRAEASDWPWQQPATPLAFEEMYSGASALGLQLSEKLQSLEGKRVVMTGFMAPPLKPTLSFFVLTQAPMAICPFCSSDADWPMDIVVVKLEQPVTALPFDRPIRVTGLLELGNQMDPETGFVSLVRIRADHTEKAE
ncbi:hypothetical protein [Acetonema longum]|uniref:DUF3299 domain-containing protein n=1 Tax=Acetonema longum DSM 6540 TaxID=1009370 RepID=F7NN61_9FIRM|nr:hypothetical protein [Acetonema longum]EGO62527.1 hypothetical protein ALO_17721 [Acetonema longum DSM 6540]